MQLGIGASGQTGFHPPIDRSGLTCLQGHLNNSACSLLFFLVPRQPEVPPVTFKQSVGGGGTKHEPGGWSQSFTLWLPYFKYREYWKCSHTQIQNTVNIPR